MDRKRRGRGVPGLPSEHGHTLINRRLYLPASWTADRARCQDAGVPDTVTFATRTELAAGMLTAAVCARVPAGKVYGNSATFGAGFRERQLEYAMAISCTHLLALDGGKVHLPVGRLAAELPADAWQSRWAGANSKGPRDYAWAWLQRLNRQVEIG